MQLLKKPDIHLSGNSLKIKIPKFDSLIEKIKKNRKVIVVCGPTCVGKSKIAINLASILETDIISVDSMQVYKGMDIGTDKYNTEKYNINQYMVDIFSPNHYVTVVEFRDLCREIIEKEFFLKNKIPLLVGGSGLYIRGVIDDLEFIPPGNKEIRNKLKEKIKENGLRTYYEKLKDIDPSYSRKISENDQRRIIRALEVYKITGKPFSFFQNKWESRKSIYNTVIFGLEVERSKLYSNIDKRVDKMFEMGLVEEVKRLVEKGYDKCYSLRQAVGYKEVLKYIKGDLEIDKCIVEVKKNTRRLAKKQMTWFKSDPRIKWIRIDNYDSILNLIKDMFKIISYDLTLG